MALKSLGQGCEFWWPILPLAGSNYAFETNQFVLSSTGNTLAHIMQVPFTGTLDRFAAHIATVTNTPDNGLLFGFQDVDLTNGNNDGVNDQSATIASGSVTTGILDPGAFSGNRSVTRGDYLACVLGFNTFVAGDSVTAASIVGPGAAATMGFPYAILNGTKSGTRIPHFWLHYTDNGGFWYPCTYVFLPPVNGASTLLSMDTGTTPDEAGIAFTLPFPATLNRVQLALQIVQAGGTLDLVLYDAASTPLATYSFDGDVFSAATTNTRWVDFYLASAVDLSANTLYRLIVKPTSTNNVGVVTNALDSTIFPFFAGGNVYRTQRTDAGAWTNFNNGSDGYGWVQLILGLSQLDDAVSTSGAASIIGDGANW